MFKFKSARRAISRAFDPLMIALGWTASAHADCRTTGLPTTFTYGAIAASNSLPVGQTIPGTLKPFTLNGKCSVSLANKDVVACPGGGTAVANMTGVYPTNLAGVGMRMRDSNGKPMVGTGACSTTSSLGKTAANGSFNVSGTFELVKTGPIQSGTISAAKYATRIFNSRAPLNNGRNLMSVASGTPVRPVSCSVAADTANQTIPLATVSPSMFASAGSTAAKTPFSIGLSCESGVKVAVTFSSVSGASGVPTVVASNGTATGVGVQLLDTSHKPITLDKALRLTFGTTGNMSFQFYAQYYRLSAVDVTAGRVNASAIFTMSYQ